MKRMRRDLLLAALLTAVPIAGTLPAQELSSEEREMAEWVAAHEEEAIALLERTVNINSGTLNAEGVAAVAAIFAGELEALGFDTRYAELPDSLNRGGHLIAERSGTGGQHVLLIGHLDTVFEEGSPFQRFERDGDRATGPGVEDMKGGDVVIVYALKALDAVGALDGATITVVMTGDEESPGRPLEVSRRHLIEAGRRADIALGFEGGSRDETGEYGVVARRSSSGWSLSTSGVRSHSSRVFSEDVGAGAIFEAARILSEWYDEVKGEEYLTFNPGVILGGSEVAYDPSISGGTATGKTNVVAERAEVRGGIRTISDEQLQRARYAMRQVVNRHRPHTDAAVTFEPGYPAMTPTAANYALLDRFSAINQALGRGPLRPFDPGARGAADISFVAPYIEAGLDGLGPHGGDGHTVHEWVDLGSMTPATQRAAILIHRLTRPVTP